MYILQISDLHISDIMNPEDLRDKIHLLKTKIEEIIPKGSSLVCCVLGDVVDQGAATLYPLAESILNDLLNQLKEIAGADRVICNLIPGNHDLCADKNGTLSLNEFNKFASSIRKTDNVFTDTCTVTENDFKGYHFINLSSVKDENYKFGEINFSELSKCKVPMNTIMLVHHSLVSGDKDDEATIRDGYQLQQFLENNKIIALLHGHTHGCKRYTVGYDCQVVGVGPMFKPVPDISNQCNLIYISGSSVKEITTFTYQGDRKEWDTVKTYTRVENNNYYGTSIYDLYERVLQDAEESSLLPNLRIQIKQNFKLFEQEILDKFSSCIEDAAAWQSFECPAFLDYTHGQLMCTKEIKWDQFAIKKLKENPTNKRTIIPLITKENAFESGDSKLVSFDTVQFGFLEDSCKDLYVTVYMRALEVRHFLPINICEVYLMAKKIKDEIRAIENITVCLLAFRAEQKTNYGCYRKSEIDLLSESKFCGFLATKNYQEIGRLLYEKSKMGDTVIAEDWLQRLTTAFHEFYKEANRDLILEKMHELMEMLLELKNIRVHCSDYSRTQPHETQFTKELETLIQMLLGGTREE